MLDADNAINEFKKFLSYSDDQDPFGEPAKEESSVLKELTTRIGEKLSQFRPMSQRSRKRRGSRKSISVIVNNQSNASSSASKAPASP